MTESGGMGGMMPWAELLGMLDLNAQGRDVVQKTSKNLQDALGPDGGSSQKIGSGSGGSNDNSGLFEALIGMGNKKNTNQNEDYFAQLNAEKANLNRYTQGNDFGSNQLPKKNYNLKLSDDSSYGF